MEPTHRIRDFEQLKTLADPRRLAILQLLMSEPATLSQLGQALGEYPAQVRHHLKLLEEAGLVELVSTRVVRGFVEKYYRARARAFIFHEILLPRHQDRETVVALGSHDLALELLAGYFNERHRQVELLALPVGSMEGLIALRQGNAQIAGCHLFDAETGEYNLPYTRHFFPERSVALITLAHREQGLLLAEGNPGQIRGLDDLAREDVRLVNRNPGSGTRLWLDRRLRELGLAPEQIRGYKREARTHTELAEAIKAGEADVGLGLRAAAHLFNLDFIPLFQERYDLVIPKDQFETPGLMPVLDHLQSSEFRHAISSLDGYDAGHTGEQKTP